ncbi:MAG: hypothetical protein JWN95_634 [Frankiales bacterium]|nr:hypothetical protein [Frankiales bacterium]
MTNLFHIVDEQLWRAARATGWYRPDSLAVEGFIHLSYRGQVLASANRHYLDYAGPGELIVVELAAADLGAPVLVEDLLQRGESFPHAYGPIATSAEVAVHRLTKMAGSAPCVFTWAATMPASNSRTS